MHHLRSIGLALATAALSCAAVAAPTYASSADLGRSWPLLNLPAEEHAWTGNALVHVFDSIDRAPTGSANANTGRMLESPLAFGEAPRQSIPAQRNPLSINLRGDSDLFLWNLVAIVHAQQFARTFDLVETNLTAFVPSANVVSQVPLPGALWLFGVGLAGLAASARRRLGFTGPVGRPSALA